MTTPKKNESTEYEALIFSAEMGAVVPELDLHALTRLEAARELEFFLDQQFMAGERVVRIIHGRGTGVLKNMVESALDAHDLVAFHRSSQNPNEQGAVTYGVLV